MSLQLLNATGFNKEKVQMDAETQPAALSIDLKSRFIILAEKMVPENLSHEGTLSQADTRSRYNGLMRQWRTLEAEAGQLVTEGDTTRWFCEVVEWHRNSAVKGVKAA